jgi:hypothetical protein
MTTAEKLQLLRGVKFREAVPEALKQIGVPRIAEVGVGSGYFTKHLLRAEPTLAVAVDLWWDAGQLGPNHIPLAQPDMERQYAEMLELQWSKPALCVLRMDSARASRLFCPHFFDFVYLDADHRYAGVKQDIALWWPLVKQGGILAGHDYKVKRNCGVITAVDELLDRHQLHRNFLKLPERAAPSWFVLKPEG